MTAESGSPPQSRRSPAHSDEDEERISSWAEGVRVSKSPSDSDHASLELHPDPDEGSSWRLAKDPSIPSTKEHKQSGRKVGIDNFGMMRVLATSRSEDDDDDEKFAPNPRRARSRSPMASYVSDGDFASSSSYAIGNEGRSLRTHSARYNPYQAYSDPEAFHADQNQFDLQHYSDLHQRRRYGSTSWSSSSFSPSLSSSNATSHRRLCPAPDIPVPVPVPNLTKKSSGRRVPTMESLEDLRSAASGAGKKRQSPGDKATRVYECDVCERCFTRSGYLARHVRVHTYGRREFLSFHRAYTDLLTDDDSFQRINARTRAVARSSVDTRASASICACTSTSSLLRPQQLCRSPRRERDFLCLFYFSTKGRKSEHRKPLSSLLHVPGTFYIEPLQDAAIYMCQSVT